ncbi:PREDICTED: protein lifeguard 4-like isoform X3 [Diuraphis noxia]|uniref:protein lifeguard 4-like isoform X3 n=1 Tax=Diuraphis noxia TaxID=143948 RepID=UPI0007638ADD|nr:PREDICTED: protein lifeguard 4-like isoform X3 [Diuraphis noxia]
MFIPTTHNHSQLSFFSIHSFVNTYCLYIDQLTMDDVNYSGKEFDNYYGVVFKNNNEDKINTSYNLLNTEYIEKQHVKVCQGNSSEYMLSITLILNVVVLIFLHMKRKQYPANLIILIIFTVIEACTVGIVVTSFDLFILLQTLILTLVSMIGVTLYLSKTKRVGLSLTEYCVLLVFTIFLSGVLVQIILGSTTYELLFSSISSLLFSMFLVHDAQKLMWKLHPEDYIFGTISIYFDVINLVPYVLHKVYYFRV